LKNPKSRDSPFGWFSRLSSPVWCTKGAHKTSLHKSDQQEESFLSMLLPARAESMCPYLLHPSGLSLHIEESVSVSTGMRENRVRTVQKKRYITHFITLKTNVG